MIGAVAFSLTLIAGVLVFLIGQAAGGWKHPFKTWDWRGFLVESGFVVLLLAIALIGLRILSKVA